MPVNWMFLGILKNTKKKKDVNKLDNITMKVFTDMNKGSSANLGEFKQYQNGEIHKHPKEPKKF